MPHFFHSFDPPRFIVPHSVVVGFGCRNHRRQVIDVPPDRAPVYPKSCGQFRSGHPVGALQQDAFYLMKALVSRHVSNCTPLHYKGLFFFPSSRMFIPRETLANAVMPSCGYADDSQLGPRHTEKHKELHGNTGDIPWHGGVSLHPASRSKRAPMTKKRSRCLLSPMLFRHSVRWMYEALSTMSRSPIFMPGVNRSYSPCCCKEVAHRRTPGVDGQQAGSWRMSSSASRWSRMLLVPRHHLPRRCRPYIVSSGAGGIPRGGG